MPDITWSTTGTTIGSGAGAFDTGSISIRERDSLTFRRAWGSDRIGEILQEIVASTKPRKVKEDTPDSILLRRVKEAIRSGARVPVQMSDRYCELVKHERHLNRDERRYFNQVKEDKVKMCDVIVEDIA